MENPLDPRTANGRKEVGLPPLVFFFTIDQIASMLALTEATIMARYLYFVGRSPGMKHPDLMEAVNVSAMPSDPPVWRVESKELVRFLKRRGFVIRAPRSDR